jgi:hypothetical protein
MAVDYQRVKFFAEKHQTPEILAALASFKRPEDVPFFLAHFNCVLPAIQRFPDATFLPKLQKEIGTLYLNADYQKAVVAYRSAESAKMLTLMVDKIVLAYPKKQDPERAEKILQLYNIIESANTLLYEPLLKKMQNY